MEDWNDLEDVDGKLDKAQDFKSTGNSLFGCGKFLAATKWYTQDLSAVAFGWTSQITKKNKKPC